MLNYLDHALHELQQRCAAEGQAFTRDDLKTAVIAGAVERVRPKMMTAVAIMAGLLPIMWSHGTRAEVMQRIAVPMIGGMVSSTVLIVIPVIYTIVKGAMRGQRSFVACAACHSLQPDRNMTGPSLAGWDRKAGTLPRGAAG